MHHQRTRRRPGRRALRRSIPIGGLAAAIVIALALVVPTIGSAQTQAAPVNTGEPQISGSAVSGQQLAATTGTWSNDPVSFAFQWLQCPSNGGAGDGSNCFTIPSATGSTYTVMLADVGYTIRVQVTATNPDGDGVATSNATAIVQLAGAKPVNTSEPTISGTATQGQLLTGTTGSWSNDPTSFAFQWLRCPPDGGFGDGSNCATIAGATGNSYTLAAADVTFRLRLRVTATNASGSASAASNPTDAVKASATAPKNTAPPPITGKPVVGQTLASGQGSWTGTQPWTFSYQWLRCDAAGGSCASIAGATGQTWKLTTSSVGHTIRVRVTATNTGGATSATSAPTAVVTATAPTPATGCPTGTGPVNVANVTSPARLLIDGQQVIPAVVTPRTTDITLRYHVSACGGRSVQGALVYATATPYNQLSIPGEQPTDVNGWAQLHFSPLAGFPVSSHQQLIAMFVRARKSGENLLGGISTRRLYSVPIKR
jgi:hypothetical protein